MTKRNPLREQAEVLRDVFLEAAEIAQVGRILKGEPWDVDIYWFTLSPPSEDFFLYIGIQSNSLIRLLFPPREESQRFANDVRNIIRKSGLGEWLVS
jgi:hypothetical protein